MTDVIFAPAPAPDASAPPGNAQLAYLRATLYVMRGMYHHPISDDDQPLPPHRWALVGADGTMAVATPARFSEGTTSDGQGISSVFRPDTSTGAPDDTWDLWLIPVFDDGKDSSEVVSLGEVWIDVDKNRWVRASEVSADGALAVIESRRLLRIPRWSTVRKAIAGGGFKETNPDASDFDGKGLIKTSELVVRGSPGTPWTIQIDQGWHRAFVQLRFYDFGATKDRALPQGVVLAMDNHDSPDDLYLRCGASSVTRSDGSIYVLGAAPLDQLDLRYSFTTPSLTELDVASDAYTAVGGPALERVGTHYWLPEAWISDDTWPWEGPAEPGDNSRKAFSTLRGGGTEPSKPLCFHLDDLVFADTDGKVVFRSNERLAIYDSRMALRDQAKVGGKPVLPWTDFKPADRSSPLPAEQAVFVRGQGADRLTRVIAHNGKLYELCAPTLLRIADGFGLGMLAAREIRGHGPDTTDMWSARARVMVLPTPWTTYSYGGKATRPLHLVTFLPLFIDVSNLAATVPAQQQAAKDAVERALYKAAGRWDQQHPGNDDPDSKNGKNYAVVPSGGVQDGSIVAKMRHIFTSEVDQTASPPVIEVWPKGRASAGSTLRVFLMQGPDTDPASSANVLTPKEMARLKPPFEFEPDDNPATDPFDRRTAMWFTLAHELGHWCGLPDEYTDLIDVNGFLPGSHRPPPKFGAGPRPFLSDLTAMMVNNQHLRLRYFHRRVCLLREALKVPFVDAPPDVLEYQFEDKTLTYAVWDPALSESPWSYFPKNAPASLGACQLSLFWIGEDEATKTGAFLPCTSGAVRATGFDGILVVASAIWFDMSRVNKSVGEQWSILARFANLFYAAASAPHFAVDTPTARHFKRVAVVFQPRFEFGPNPSKDASVGKATLVVSVRETPGTPTLTLGRIPTVDVYRDDVGMWIMRYALQQDTSTLPSTVVNGPLTAADLVTTVQQIRSIAENAKLDPPGRPLGTASPYT